MNAARCGLAASIGDIGVPFLLPLGGVMRGQFDLDVVRGAQGHDVDAKARAQVAHLAVGHILLVQVGGRGVDVGLAGDAELATTQLAFPPGLLPLRPLVLVSIAYNLAAFVSLCSYTPLSHPHHLHHPHTMQKVTFVMPPT